MHMKLVNNKGMTLVEVLVATAIFAFCLSGLLLTYMNLFILTDIARDSTIANNALQAKIEELKSVGFEQLASSSFNIPDNDAIINGSAMIMGNGTVGIYSDVTDPFTNVTYSDMKRARVIIYYKSRNRNIGPVEGTTLIKNFTNSTS